MSGEDITQSGTQWIEKTTEASYAQTDITIQAEENGNLYLYVTASDIDNISVIEDENSESYSIDTPYIIDLGYHAKGSSYHLIVHQCPSANPALKFTLTA